MDSQSNYHPDTLNDILGNISNVQEEDEPSRGEQTIHEMDERPAQEDRKMPQKGIIGLRNGKVQKAELGSICRKEAESKWEAKKEDHLVRELTEINRKLFEDNKILMGECIKLKKTLKTLMQNSPPNIQSANKKLEQLERKLCAQHKQIRQLTNQNKKLKDKLIQMKESGLSIQKVMSESAEVRALREQIEMLTKKLEQSQKKQYGGKHSGGNSMITSASKISDLERDRIISNMRIVYQNQIKLLKQQVREREEQLFRLNRAIAPSKQKQKSPQMSQTN